MAAADELRWCLRSLVNVSGCNPVPLVVGDPPDWYTGPRLDVPPSGGRKADVTRKLRAIIASDLVANTFIALADDNVVVEPIELDDLWTPRHQPNVTKESNGWLGLRFKTCQWLRDRDLPDVDVSTHWPYGWEKSKLAETLDWIGDGQLLIETVYANHHSQRTKPSSDFRYVNHTRGICEEARVISFNDRAFLRGVRNELWARFPEPRSWEAGEVPRIQTLGVIDSARMYACPSLGNPVRVEGKTVIFECRKFGEAALFGGVEYTCDKCDEYRATRRVVKIGRVTGVRQTCGRALTSENNTVPKTIRQGSVRMSLCVMELRPNRSSPFEHLRFSRKSTVSKGLRLKRPPNLALSS